MQNCEQNHKSITHMSHKVQFRLSTVCNVHIFGEDNNKTLAFLFCFTFFYMNFINLNHFLTLSQYKVSILWTALPYLVSKQCSHPNSFADLWTESQEHDSHESQSAIQCITSVFRWIVRKKLKNKRETIVVLNNEFR